MSKVTDLIRLEIEPIIVAQNDEFIDIEYVKENNQNYLRIYVDDEPSGIDIDEIANLSEKISEKLDSLDPDPLPDPYVLELSSPGAERPIKNKRDWKRALGKYVYVGLYQKIDNKKIYEGTLKSYNDKQIELVVQIKTRKKTLNIPRNLIAKIRFAIKF